MPEQPWYRYHFFKIAGAALVVCLVIVLTVVFVVKNKPTDLGECTEYIDGRIADIDCMATADLVGVFSCPENFFQDDSVLDLCHSCD